MKIFLSYGHDENAVLGERINHDLESRDHDVWIDKTEIKFGDGLRRPYCHIRELTKWS